MSIQSANTDVLFHMKRKYTQEDVRKSLQAIAERVPGSFVGMDVITGFPTETEEQFEDTYQTLSELPWPSCTCFLTVKDRELELLPWTLPSIRTFAPKELRACENSACLVIQSKPKNKLNP